MKEIRAVKIIAECAAGAHITTSIEEAVIMSMEKQCVVEFRHNDKVYVVDPMVILRSVVAGAEIGVTKK